MAAVPLVAWLKYLHSYDFINKTFIYFYDEHGRFCNAVTKCLVFNIKYNVGRTTDTQKVKKYTDTI